MRQFIKKSIAVLLIIAMSIGIMPMQGFGETEQQAHFSFDIFNNGAGGTTSRPNQNLADSGLIRMWSQLDGVVTPVSLDASLDLQNMTMEK